MDNLKELQREVLARRDEYRNIETELTNHYEPAKILSDEERERLIERLRELKREVTALYTKIVKKEAENDLAENKRAAYDDPVFGSGRVLSDEDARKTKFKLTGKYDPDKYKF